MRFNSQAHEYVWYMYHAICFQLKMILRIDNLQKVPSLTALQQVSGTEDSDFCRHE